MRMTPLLAERRTDDAVARIQDIPRPVPDTEGTGLDGWTRTRDDGDEITLSDIGREFAKYSAIRDTLGFSVFVELLFF